MKIKWEYISLFILLALGLSFPVQQGYLNDFFRSIAKGTILSGSVYLLAGISTLFAGAVALAIHQGVSDKISILGKERTKNLIILGLPIIAFSISGLNNNLGINKNVFAFCFSLVNTIYAFAEEFGWRRYLQNALENMSKNWKYISIGAVWWLWHFRFSSQFDFFIFPLICIGGGFLLGKLADKSGSILPVVAMHNLIIITTNSGNFGKEEIIGGVLVVVGWVVVEKIWKDYKLAK